MSQSKPWNLVTIAPSKAGLAALYVYNSRHQCYAVNMSCQAFEKHTKQFYSSVDFKAKAQDAVPFFKSVKDYVFGRPTTLENAVCDTYNPFRCI